MTCSVGVAVVEVAAAAVVAAAVVAELGALLWISRQPGEERIVCGRGY